MRNVWILTLTQALAACGTLVLIAFGGIIGARIAPSPALATLPLSLGVVGVAAMSIPAALSMQRYGRRPMFIASALCAAVAALGCSWAVAHAHFAAFCAGALVLGANMAYVQQYRFAATEYVDVAQVPRAIATVTAQAIASLVAGAAIATIGWRATNLVMLPVLAAMLVAVLAWRRSAG